AQVGTRTFNVVATDAAGNTASQTLTMTVDTPKVDILLTLTKPDGSPLTSLAIGQDFVLHVSGQDIRAAAHGVFALYTDITFEGTKATITGPITYSSTYGGGRSGTTGTGLVDEVGAFAGTNETGANPVEVFSVPMRATASGIIKFLTDPAETVPLHNVLQYNPGNDPSGSDPIPNTQFHFGSASIEVSPTFNAVNDSFNVTEDTQNNSINPLANDTNIGSNTSTLTISAVG